jgi:hypothetical protein
LFLAPAGAIIETILIEARRRDAYRLMKQYNRDGEIEYADALAL